MKYAGFWRRCAALVVDGVIVSVVVTALALGVNAVFGEVVLVTPNVNIRSSQTVVLEAEQRTNEDGAKEIFALVERKDTYFGLWSNHYRGEIRKTETTSGNQTTTLTKGKWWPIDPDTKEKVSRLSSGTIELLILLFVYWPLAEASRGQASLGKRLFGLIVVDETGGRLSFRRALGRNAGKIISMLILLVGFLMAVWTEKKQCLHDKMAKTLVIRRPLTQKNLDEVFA